MTQGRETNRSGDVLGTFRHLGVATDFAVLRCRAGIAFDAWDRAYALERLETVELP